MNPPLALARWMIALAVLLICARVAQAEPWDAQDARHADALKAFVSDSALFPRLSNGAVSGCIAEPAHLVRYLKRQGVEIDADDADLLLKQVSLKVKGRKPGDIRADALVTAYRPGSSGRHGDFAELDYIKQNPGSAVWSGAGSQTTDITFRGLNGEVIGYGQLKCKSTAMSSAHGVVENFVKSQSSDWPGKKSLEFIGLIPSDQFDELVKRGVLDADGTMKPAEFEKSVAQIDRNLESNGYGAQNRERLRVGRKAIGSPASGAPLMRFKPLPQTYAELREMADKFDADIIRRQAAGGQNQLLRPPSLRASKGVPGTRWSAAISVAGGLAGFAVIGSAQDAPRATLNVLDAASGLAAESGGFYNGNQKRALDRLVKRLPKALRPKLPRVASIRQISRVATRAAVVVTVLYVGWETYQFLNGKMSTREFQSSMAGLGGGLLGGAAAGATAGLAGGPFVYITVPVCSAIGAIIGWIAGSSAVDNYWSSLDKAELDYAIELIRKRIDAELPK